MKSNILTSRLLRPILLAVVIVSVLQAVIMLSMTNTSVSNLVDKVVSTLNQGNQEMSGKLDTAGSEVGAAIERLSAGATTALNTTLTQQLTTEQAQVEQLLVNSVQDTAKGLAELMALVSPDAIWDNDSGELTRLVRDLHRNESVVFARYYNADGNPLSRYTDKRNPKVKELISKGEGRKSFDKLLSGARKDPSIYIVEIDINPKGAVIGRFILGVTNQKALDAIAE